MKKVPPKTIFAEQSRKHLEKGCEQDANDMPMYTKSVQEWSHHRCPKSSKNNEKKVMKQLANIMKNDDKTMQKCNVKS